MVRVLIGVFIALCAHVAFAASELALGYEPKYLRGFTHFDYVNPNAPKGGSVTLGAMGSFDSLNPYLLKGIPAGGIGELVFESLLKKSDDEPFTMYGLLADDAALAPDGLSVTFHLNPLARFSDATPVTAADVKYSFEMMTSKFANPMYQFYWGDIKRVVVVDRLTVRFEFAQRNSELHMIVGELPIFSRAWGSGKTFDKVVTDKPIASGPYVLGDYEFGKYVSYKRNENYWAKDLPVRRGQYNFDRIQFRYYLDDTVLLEAFKAGEFDFNAEFSAKRWAKEYTGSKFTTGVIKKAEFKHSNAQGMQGFAFNIRRPLFKDKRVRKALSLAFDFEWANQNLFYGQYVRNSSYYNNAELASSAIPTGEELALLEPFRDKLPSALFTTEWRPSNTDAPNSLRTNLLQAKKLLEEAGWKVKNGVLRNERDEAFVFEMVLVQKAFERIVAPYSRALSKLGIQMEYRLVDPALYKRRLDRFEFDMTVVSFPVSQSPGNELINRFGSKAADQEGSDNYIGIKDPVVDALVGKIVMAPDRHSLVMQTRALDRVLLWSEYVVPNWYIPYHRVAYRSNLRFPEKLPLYYSALTWMLETWWVDSPSR